MRIGILTFHNSRNFGANLQSLATQEMLRKLGHEPVMVNYIDAAKLAALDQMNSPEQIAKHEDFAERYYSLSQPLRSPEEVADYCCEELDGVVAGSDAVFRLATPYQPKRMVKKLLGHQSHFSALSWDDRVPPFFLPFEAPKVIKGSIAASSRGTPFYFLRPSMMWQVGKALRGFDFVTVRDEWTGNMVRWLSAGAVKPHYCPDPVFGLNSAFDLPEDEKPTEDLSRAILLTGNFDKDWLKRMVAAIHAHGYRAVTLANPHEKETHDFVDDVLGLPMSPLRWYACLSSCAGFIGMRFHAFVSCVANRTPVVTMDVAKPMFRRYDARNPNFDLANRIGIHQNYFLRRDLMTTAPEVVLERLFDVDMLSGASAYAGQAPSMLFGVLGRFCTHGGQ